MTCQITSIETLLSLWDSTPIGKSIYLYLCQHEQFSPQLILEDKIFRSAIYLLNNTTNCSQIKFIGTLISDDESQRLIYVIDRLLLKDLTINEINKHCPLSGEFLIPIQCNDNNSITINNLIQNGIKEIDAYCHSSLPIELYQFSYLCGQMLVHHSSSITADLSFNLLTIKDSFILTPINPKYIQILPTTLFNNLNSSTRNNIYTNKPHFGYCSLNGISKNQVLLLLENDPQACTLPLVGIWITGVVDIQCAFVWSACIRYCMNSSLKQRLRSGKNSQQSFLLVFYLSTSNNQCIFYDVNLVVTNNSITSKDIDYDVWICSKKITISNLPYDINDSTQFTYDFDFKRVYNGSNNEVLLENDSSPTKNKIIPMDRSCFSREISLNDNNQHHYQTTTLSSPNTNGSLFGIPRLPPKQSTCQSPSWDLLSTTPMITPKRIVQSPTTSPKYKKSSTPIPSTMMNDTQWKEEIIERIQSYETHIQSLTSLVAQLLTAQKQQSQQNLIIPKIKECTKHDVAVQSESLSTIKTNQQTLSSPKIENCQQQTSFIKTIDKTSLSSPVTYQQESTMDCSSLRKSATPTRSTAPPSTSISTDTNPVDILKPIFQFIDNQQRQHVTSTRTTGISLISNGVQMQFINQQSSTTSVYPQSQLLPTSPQKSENNLSVEVHGLEMKYLEDDQLAAAIECDRQSHSSLNVVLPQTTQIIEKSLSFGTEEYLRRYDLFTESNP